MAFTNRKSINWLPILHRLCQHCVSHCYFYATEAGSSSRDRRAYWTRNKFICRRRDRESNHLLTELISLDRILCLWFCVATLAEKKNNRQSTVAGIAWFNYAIFKSNAHVRTFNYTKRWQAVGDDTKRDTNRAGKSLFCPKEMYRIGRFSRY